MSHSLIGWLAIIGMAAGSGGLLYSGFRNGAASGGAGVRFSRSKDPFTYWLLMAIFAVNFGFFTFAACQDLAYKLGL